MYFLMFEIKYLDDIAGFGVTYRQKNIPIHLKREETLKKLP